jgi:hypothetical protein
VAEHNQESGRARKQIKERYNYIERRNFFENLREEKSLMFDKRHEIIMC